MNTFTYPVTNKNLLHYRRSFRRKKILRRRVAFLTLSVLLVLLFTFFFGTIITQANTEFSETTYKYFKTYEVEKGDTLWSLAKENMNHDFYHNGNDYINEVIQINHLDNDNIYVGQKLIIPYFSNEYY